MAAEPTGDYLLWPWKPGWGVLIAPNKRAYIVKMEQASFVFDRESTTTSVDFAGRPFDGDDLQEVLEQLREAQEENKLLSEQCSNGSAAIAQLQQARDGYMEQAIRARVLLEDYTGLILETQNNPTPEAHMKLYHAICAFLDKGEEPPDARGV